MRRLVPGKNYLSGNFKIMIIKRNVYFSAVDEYGDERLFSTTELMNEEDYIERLYSYVDADGNVRNSAGKIIDRAGGEKGVELTAKQLEQMKKVDKVATGGVRPVGYKELSKQEIAAAKKAAKAYQKDVAAGKIKGAGSLKNITAADKEAATRYISEHLGNVKNAKKAAALAAENSALIAEKEAMAKNLAKMAKTNKKMKVALGVGGGLAALGGVGAGVYHSSKN
jgi:hypothetical protein